MYIPKYNQYKNTLSFNGRVILRTYIAVRKMMETDSLFIRNEKKSFKNAPPNERNIFD